MLLVALSSAACGLSTDTKSSFTVRILGSLGAPFGDVGDRSPLSQTYLFQGVTLITADCSTPVKIYDGDLIARRIVNRPQIISTKR